MLVLIVKIDIKPEFCVPFMESMLEDARGAQEDEPGCLRFDVIQDDKEPNRIYLYEVYTDQAAFDAHVLAPHFIQWRDKVADWFVSPPEVSRGTNLSPTDAKYI